MEEIVGKTIKNIYCKNFDIQTNGYSNIIFELDDVYLTLTVNDDTDEFEIAILPAIDSVLFEIPYWSTSLVGKKIVGVWKPHNQKGYSDFLALGIDEFIPTISMSTIASEIKLGFVRYMDANCREFHQSLSSSITS
ncbi:DUF6334 family protein [Bacteroides sp. 519]|uniref:DUF6334 family protein n=1 Tax=Bacteroides sp. 519 TaxID=2302937 RepID=UPI0013CF4CD6|nr:DUF6334 family protein [Bacteroides sp. 519]NDV60538.1 hypothetical protein [Bacteroides sp. 519]